VTLFSGVTSLTRLQNGLTILRECLVLCPNASCEYSRRSGETEDTWLKRSVKIYNENACDWQPHDITSDVGY